MGGKIESEIKLRMPGPAPAREALARLGARLVRSRHLEDNTLLDDASRSLMRSGCLLRLRRTEAGSVLTFKGPRSIEEGIKSREEIETAAESPVALLAILARLGLQPVFRYQKYRESYAWEEVEIVLDETPIGTFLEIEGPLAGIHKAAAALGHGPEDYVTNSYVGLFRAAGGTGDMLFDK